MFLVIVVTYVSECVRLYPKSFYCVHKMQVLELRSRNRVRATQVCIGHSERGVKFLSERARSLPGAAIEFLTRVRKCVALSG